MGVFPGMLVGSAVSLMQVAPLEEESTEITAEGTKLGLAKRELPILLWPCLGLFFEGPVRCN